MVEDEINILLLKKGSSTSLKKSITPNQGKNTKEQK